MVVTTSQGPSRVPDLRVESGQSGFCEPGAVAGYRKRSMPSTTVSRERTLIRGASSYGFVAGQNTTIDLSFRSLIAMRMDGVRLGMAGTVP